jgi:hypothetical protein
MMTGSGSGPSFPINRDQKGDLSYRTTAHVCLVIKSFLKNSCEKSAAFDFVSWSYFSLFVFSPRMEGDIITFEQLSGLSFSVVNSFPLIVELFIYDDASAIIIWLQRIVCCNT